MYDIDLLEKQWKIYNKKRKYPLYFMMTGVLLFLGLGYYFLIKNSTTEGTPSISESPIGKDKKEKKSITTYNILLNDSLNGIDIYQPENENSLKRQTAADTIIPIEPVEDIPILEEKTAVPAIKKQKEQKKKKKKIVMHIQETTSISAYKDVEKRFYQSHDIDDSLFLARGYYAKKNFKKAEYWAFQTIKVNRHIDESWIIFAKSKVKLGERNEAIHILESYVKKSNSNKAKRLLQKLQNENNAI